MVVTEQSQNKVEESQEGHISVVRQFIVGVRIEGIRRQ